MNKNQKKIYIFTSAACNYLPKVRLLTKSIRDFHPECYIVVGLSDALNPSEQIPDETWDEVISVAQLDIPRWRPWAFTHNIVELSTAIKPFLLLSLLQRDNCAAVYYFDPDMVLFSRVDDMFAHLQGANIVLTPHLTTQESGIERVIDNEISSLKHGVYNLGFIGVNATSEGFKFTEWWADRTYHFCRDDIPNGLFTDQRWIDLAPALFDGVSIARNPRFNVAPWNLTTRTLTGNKSSGLLVNGYPLGFYHFTGFDSGAHRIMAAKYNACNTTLIELVDWYEDRCRVASTDSLSRRKWAFGYYSDGTLVQSSHRRIFQQLPELQTRYEDPFLVLQAQDCYLNWIHSTGARQYPTLLPTLSKSPDWSPFIGTLRPSLSTPAESVDRSAQIVFASMRSVSGVITVLRYAWTAAKRDGARLFLRKLLRLVLRMLRG